MMGAKSGLQALLKADVPNVFVLGCICHSFHLCASKAAEVIPTGMETFLRDVSAYFSRSGKRQCELSAIQDMLQVVHTEF
jgi:hypothetical protein